MINALISLLERNCNPCQATLCHQLFKITNISRQDQTFKKQILECR